MGILTGPTPASVIIVTHNSAPYIAGLLRSIGDDPQGPVEVIVVDNASSDESASVAEETGAIVIRSNENLGFAGGCHAGAAAAQSDTLVFLNPDMTVTPGWLPPLVQALRLTDVGAACATVELAGSPGNFQTSGGSLTFYGVAWGADEGSPVPPGSDPVVTQFPTGAAMAIRTATWDRFEGFRRDLFMYYEDVDLGWRLRTCGLRSIRVPASRVHHDYEFSRNPHKLHLLERNRLAVLAANYRASTRVVLLPALIAVEAGVLVVAIRDGWWRSKLASWGAAWGMRAETKHWRKLVQQNRTVGDAALVAEMGVSLSGVSQLQVPAGAGLATKLLGGYRRLVLPLIRFGDRRRGLA